MQQLSRVGRFLAFAILATIGNYAFATASQITTTHAAWHSHRIARSQDALVCMYVDHQSDDSRHRLLANKTVISHTQWGKSADVNPNISQSVIYHFDIAFANDKWVAVWIQDGRLFQATSADGARWQPPSLLLSNINSSIDSQLRISAPQSVDECAAANPAAHWVIAFEDGHSIMVLESFTNANSWPASATCIKQVSEYEGYYLKDMACDRQNNWTITGVAATKIPQTLMGTTFQHIFVSRSSGNGTWTALPHQPTEIIGMMDGLAIEASVAAVDNNVWAVSWQDIDTNAQPCASGYAPRMLMVAKGVGNTQMSPVNIVTTCDYLSYADLASTSEGQFCLVYKCGSTALYHTSWSTGAWGPSTTVPSFTSGERLRSSEGSTFGTIVFSWIDSLSPGFQGHLWCSSNATPQPNPWLSFGLENPDKAYTTRDLCDNSYRAHIVPRPTATGDRVSGWIQSMDFTHTYASVGSGNHVRGKFYVYRGGQEPVTDANQIPALRIRVQTRFAACSILEVFSRVSGFPGDALIALDVRPSANSERPSLYRVDFDPIEVPYMRANPTARGMATGAFEALEVFPETNGYLAMQEAQFIVYSPSILVPAGPIKTYRTSQTDAGDLGLQFVEASCLLYPGPWVPVSVTTGPNGVTIDSTAVPASQIAAAMLEFSPDRGQLQYSQRLRVEEGLQYHVRYHLKSEASAATQSQIRMRARSLGFAWTQRLEIGGAWALGQGLSDSNIIAQELLPGNDSQSPDFGWYTLVMHTPLSQDIRSDSPVGTPLSESMPSISAQPGSGSSGSSRRDFRVAIDVIDSLSYGDTNNRESTHVTLDEIVVRPYLLLED